MDSENAILSSPLPITKCCASGPRGTEKCQGPSSAHGVGSSCLSFRRNAKEGPGGRRPPARREPTYPGGWLGLRPPARAAGPGAAGGRRLRAGPACWLFLQPRAFASDGSLAVPRCPQRLAVRPSGPAGGAGEGSARRVRARRPGLPSGAVLASRRRAEPGALARLLRPPPASL